jgi:hypothetical protein
MLASNDVENDKNVAVGVDDNVKREMLSVLNEDILNFRAHGFAVDNNNKPAPDNIPTSSDSGTDEDMYQPWGSAEPLDASRVAGVRDVQPSLVSANPSMHSVLDFFLHFLQLFETTVLQATNKPSG